MKIVSIMGADGPYTQLVIRTPSIVIRGDDPDLFAGAVEAWEAQNDGEDQDLWQAGDLEALDAQAVAALCGRREAWFEFTGRRAELIDLARSSLADLLSDPRMRVTGCHTWPQRI